MAAWQVPEALRGLEVSCEECGEESGGGGWKEPGHIGGLSTFHRSSNCGGSNSKCSYLLANMRRVCEQTHVIWERPS